MAFKPIRRNLDLDAARPQPREADGDRRSRTSHDIVFTDRGMPDLALTPDVQRALGAAEPGDDFPRTLVGTRAVEPEPAVFNVGNIYAGPAQISSVTFAGANPKDFAVTNNGCRAEVAVGSTCPLEVIVTITPSGS